MNSKPATLSMRRTLILLLFFLLIGSFAAIAAVAYTTTSSSLRDLAEALFGEISKATEEKARGHLSPGCVVLEKCHARARRGLLPLDDPDRLGAWLVEELRYDETLDEITYGDARGYLTAASRDPEGGGLVLRRIRPTPEGPVAREEAVDEDGRRRLIVEEPRDYDPRRRTWYELAVASPGVIWTEPYQWTSGARGITCTRAVREGDRVRGVLTADFRLDALSDFLAGLEIGETGRAFLIDRRGRITAGPKDEQARGAVKAVLDELGMERLAALEGGRPHFIPVDFEGERTAAAVQFFRLEGGLEWASLVAVPEREFLGAVRMNLRWTAGVAVLSLLLALVLGAYLTAAVVRPLQSVSEDLARVAEFELSDEPAPGTFVREIAQVGEAAAAMKAGLRSFGRYVPKEVVRALVAQGDDARLGGEARLLTIHFSDIEGFTGLSEGRAATKVVEDLSHYLNAMCGVIADSAGTIDKFMGDGIMAFWGAPAILEDHAARGCAAALSAQRRLAELRPLWKAEDRPPYRARIGLHSGEVLVGNIGTEDRFSYTVIGDAANLAARLEALNKAYGSYILVSEDTKALAGDRFEWRLLDRTAVYGRRAGVLVYELLAEKGELGSERAALRDEYERCLALYFARSFAEAAAGFAALKEKDPQDRAAALMEERARSLDAAGVDEGWTGVFVQTSK